MESIWIKEIKADRNCVTYHLDVSEGLVRYFSPGCEMFAEFGFDISNIPKSVLAVPVLSNIMQFAWLFDCLVWIEEVDQQFYESIMKKIMFGNSLMLLGIAIMILAGLELIYIGIVWASFLLIPVGFIMAVIGFFSKDS